MAKVVGDIAVKVGADVTPLQRNMKRAGQSVDDFDKRAKAMALNVAKAGAAIAGAMVAASSAVFALAKEAAGAAVEIKNLSAIAGVGTTEFQRYSVASRSVGIEQEKLADIFKDVNDKFGDFMATGAGPLADFFENIAPQVGVTADQFARLSGPEALQLYVSSLEKAGVSQQQMTFYMEALASDATALIPLLRDNGRAMRTLGDEAERTGQIMDRETVAAGAELDRVLDGIGQTLRTSVNAAVLENAEELQDLADTISEMIPILASFVSGLAQVVTGLGNVATAAIEAAREVKDFFDNIPVAEGSSSRRRARNGTSSIVSDGDGGTVIELGGPLGRQPGQGRNPGIFAADVNPGEASEAGRGTMPARTPSTGMPSNMTLGGPLDPSGGLLPEKTPLQLAREAWEERLEVEEEGSARLVDITKKTAEEMAALEAIAQQARFNDIRGAFGDLSSLMQSENKKLFKVGQAAALAEATISGYKSAVEAWEKGMTIGGPPVAAAFTAASLAKTGMLINQIASASSSGRGSSSGGGGGATSGGTAQAPQQEVTTFSFTLQNDPMGFGESFARQMIEQLNSAQRDGGRIQAVLT